jgi:hypothetical protein
MAKRKMAHPLNPAQRDSQDKRDSVRRYEGKEEQPA